MRVTRMKVKAKKGRQTRNVLLCIILFFVSAGFLGVAIGKFFVIPYISGSSTGHNLQTDVQNSDDKTDVSESTKNDMKEFIIPEITFYIVQVGAFAELKNAQQMVEQMQQSGYTAGIIQNDYYKVALAVYTDKQKAVYEKSIIQKNEIDCSVTNWSSPNIQISYTTNFQESIDVLEKSINLLLDCFIKESDIIYESKYSNLQVSNLGKRIDSIQQNLNNLDIYIKIEECPDKLKPVFEQIQNVKDKYIKHISECENNLYDSKLYGLLYKGYMDMIDCIQIFYEKIGNLE